MSAAGAKRPEQNIWLTGAAGFLGRRIAAHLEHAGARVIRINRPGRSGDIAWDLTHAADASVQQAMRERPPAAIVHAAAVLPQHADAEANVAMAKHVCGAAAEFASAAHVVFISTYSVYACPDVPNGPFAQRPMSLFSPYAESKHAAERVFRQRLPEAQLSVIRPSSIYGAGMAQTVLPILLQRALRSEPITLSGSRDYRQNFVSVDDVARGTAHAAIDRLAGTFDAFGPGATSLVELAEAVMTAAGKRVDVVDECTDAFWPDVNYTTDGLKALNVEPVALASGLESMMRDVQTDPSTHEVEAA